MRERGRTPIQRRVATWIPYAWLLVFFLLPFLIVVKISLSQGAVSLPPYTPVFRSPAEIGAKLRQLSFDNYVYLTQDALYWKSYVWSVVIAALSAGLTLIIGYPIAYGMARAPLRIRSVLFMLVILPFWTSFLIRVYAWIAILKPEGLLSHLLISLGLISTPLHIINTNWAVFIGMVYSYLPFMILPLYATLEKLDPSLLEAAADLGARPLGVFWKVTFPLSIPGVVAGLMLVFIPAVGEFVIPDLLGGAQTLMIGRTLWNEFFLNRDWPLASAVAIVLLIILVAPIVYFQNVQAKLRESGS
jgi:putrescine transport system permease protein